jgi:ABC-type nitrate/sulfonate/bicarbonate transport system substrate-binding protein
MISQRTSRVVIASLSVFSLLLAACGGSAPTTSSPSAAPTQAAATAAPRPTGPTDPITIAVTSLTAGNAVTYIALAEGFFKEANVEVKTLDAAGPNLLNLVVSGQADLGQGSMTNALTATLQDKPMKVLFQYQGNAAGGFLAAKNEYTSLSQIKRVGAGGPGTSIFGYCNFFKAAAKATWECVPMESYTVRKAAFLSGQIDGVMDTYAQLYDMVEKGQAKPMIDVRKPEVRRLYMKEDTGDAGIWGLTETLEKKREAVTRFMTAIGKAVTWIDTHTDLEVGQSLKKLKTYEALTVENLAGQEKNYREVNHPNKGYITEAAWRVDLDGWALWGLGEAITSKINDPIFSYQQRVDMSFYEAGIGKPK